MSIYILPIIFIIIFIYAYIKKVNCYDSFIKGAKEAFNLCLSIFPYIASIMIAVNLLQASGISNFISTVLSPCLTFLGIPNELCELILLRPFTGSGSLAMLRNILTQYGADSYISRCACTIIGCSETIFYVATIYLSQTKIKKLLYAIPVALFASFCGAIFACFICKII